MYGMYITCINVFTQNLCEFEAYAYVCISLVCTSVCMYVCVHTCMHSCMHRPCITLRLYRPVRVCFPVSMGSGSSRDPLRVGLQFLGVLSAIILSIVFVCLIWKMIEVLVEKYRRKSIPHGQREPPDGEVQVEVRGFGPLKFTMKVVEMLKKKIPGSAAGTPPRLSEAPYVEDGRERLCAAAADDETKSIMV